MLNPGYRGAPTKLPTFKVGPERGAKITERAKCVARQNKQAIIVHRYEQQFTDKNVWFKRCSIKKFNV